MGLQNKGNRNLIPGFLLSRSNMLKLFPMLARWAALEVREGWRSWGDPTETLVEHRTLNAQR